MMKKSQKCLSSLGGTMIIAGTMMGAGMFSLPIMMAGAWFYWSIALLMLTCFLLYQSGIMLLESNLHFAAGASFDTMCKTLIGQKWNMINGLSLIFVLYIISYAYISASGSVIHETLHNVGIAFPARAAGFIFALIVGFIVWLSTKAVSRMTTLVLGAKILTFLITVAGLMFHVNWSVLSNTESHQTYLPYLFVTLPFCLASFGFHSSVPSIVKFYQKDAQLIRRCILHGSILGLVIYVLWLIVTMGTLPRSLFPQMMQEGGNLDVFMQAILHVVQSQLVSFALTLFSNFAVACSFLGVTLGLFDYLADLFSIANNKLGRFKCVLLTFLPSIIASLIYPNGFLYAVGFAGLAATIWMAFTPALLAYAARKRFPKPAVQASGGTSMIIAVLIFGLLTMISFILHLLHLLPVF